MTRSHIPTIQTTQRHRWTLGVAAMVAMALACVDGLRPRSAMFDWEGLEFDVVPVHDTVRAQGDVALYFIQSDRIHHDFPVQWSAAPGGMFGIFGGGIIGLAVVPSDTVQAWVYATIGPHTDSARLVVIP